MPKSVFSKSYAALLDLLIQTRKEAEISQADLGHLVGRRQTFISAIETGVRRIDLIEFYVIMIALGANPEEKVRQLFSSLPKKVERL